MPYISPSRLFTIRQRKGIIKKDGRNKNTLSWNTPCYDLKKQVINAVNFATGSDQGAWLLRQMFNRKQLKADTKKQQQLSTMGKMAKAHNRYPKQHKALLLAQFQQEGCTKKDITRIGINVSKHQWQRSRQLLSTRLNKAMLTFLGQHRRDAERALSRHASLTSSTR